MGKLEEVLKKVKRAANGVSNIITNGQPPEIMGITKDKGEFGEFASEYVLNNMALTDLSYIRTIHNVYLDNSGMSTELDVIAITEKGIFVLESKNYSGWIFGSYDSQKWTQSFQNGEKNSFYNPIKQNAAHIKKLAQFLNLGLQFFYSYIVFSNRCEFKNIPVGIERIKVIHREQLLWCMKKELKTGINIFSREDIDAIYNRLLPLTQKTIFEKQQHVDEVRNLKSGNFCPFCKKELVLRHGQWGDFYGCSGYPKCKFTRKIQ